MKGATIVSFVSAVVFLISIHAPREGSDTVALDVTVLGDISIHAPREGSDGKGILDAC